MPTLDQNKRYRGTAKDALASGVAQMQAVQGLGRSTMRGGRVNEMESLVLYCEADGAGASYTIDLSAKFERVEAIFGYNLTTATAITELNAIPTPATNHPAKMTVTVTAALNDKILLTIVGKLLPTI